jgi:hypothetical protein
MKSPAPILPLSNAKKNTFRTNRKVRLANYPERWASAFDAELPPQIAADREAHKQFHPALFPPPPTQHSPGKNVRSSISRWADP